MIRHQIQQKSLSRKKSTKMFPNAKAAADLAELNRHQVLARRQVRIMK